MPAVEFKVEVGFTSSLANLLVFDFSFIDVGGTVQTLGVFGNSFSNYFDGPLDDVSQYIDGSVTIRRGRDDLLSDMQAGTCSFTLCDTANPGTFNPQNPGSAFVAQVPGLVPMRPLKVSATYSGTTYGLFYGFMQSASFSMDGTVGKLQITCVDLFLWLSRVSPKDIDAFVGTAPTEDGDGGTIEDATEADVTFSSGKGFLLT
jgi:hypothetical protein